MDFQKFNGRAHAEAGARMQILDPNTREPVDGAFVMVRGVASPTIQSAQRKFQLDRMKARKNGKADAPDMVMEDAHNDLVDAAIPFIAGFEGVEYDGRKLTVENAREFLDWTFPAMGIVTDANGDPVEGETKDSKGEIVKVPKYELKNLPFAKQIGDFAGEQSNFLPSAPKG